MSWKQTAQYSFADALLIEHKSLSKLVVCELRWCFVDYAKVSYCTKRTIFSMPIKWLRQVLLILIRHTVPPMKKCHHQGSDVRIALIRLLLPCLRSLGKRVTAIILRSIM